MMQFRCLIPWNRFFEFFQDMNDSFGDDWRIMDDNDDLRYLGGGSSKIWNGHVSKLKTEPKMNNKEFHAYVFYYAIVNTDKNDILFKLKWGG